MIRRVLISVFLLLLSTELAKAASPPAKGDNLPEILLAMPGEAVHRDYLGLSGKGQFQIPQIKADIVLVEIFSMYCPACQREAPRVNELYRLIEENPEVRGKVKLIGIGAGNTPFEVEVFRKKYDVPFPLFADGDYAIHKSIGEVRTPFFIGVKMTGTDAGKVFLARLGGFDKAGDFLASLLESSGLK
jgi:peroxiredoxin